MKTTVYCPQCDWSTTRSTKPSADCSLRMHTGRKHGNIKVPSGEGIRSAPVAEVEEAPVKRKYARRIKQEASAHRFCPQCGLDQQLVAMGMAVAAKMK